MSHATDLLPRWSVSDVHESFEARSFVTALESAGASTERAVALFDEHGIGAIEPREATAEDAAAADAVIAAVNDASEEVDLLFSYVYATVSTDSRNERAQALLSELESIDTRLRPLLARLADWVQAIHAGSGGDERGGRRARRPLAASGRALGPPDAPGRGGSVRHAADDRVVGLGAPAARRHLPADR